MRRRVIDGTKEMWYFFSAQLKKLQKLAQNNTEMQSKINFTLGHGIDHKRLKFSSFCLITDVIGKILSQIISFCRSMLHVANQLSKVDGYAVWRKKEAQDLSKLIQKRLHHLQNPSNCSSARKLVCDFNKVNATGG